MNTGCMVFFDARDSLLSLTAYAPFASAVFKRGYGQWITSLTAVVLAATLWSTQIWFLWPLSDRSFWTSVMPKPGVVPRKQALVFCLVLFLIERSTSCCPHPVFRQFIFVCMRTSQTSFGSKVKMSNVVTNGRLTDREVLKTASSWLSGGTSLLSRSSIHFDRRSLNVICVRFLKLNISPDVHPPGDTCLPLFRQAWWQLNFWYDWQPWWGTSPGSFWTSPGLKRQE